MFRVANDCAFLIIFRYVYNNMSETFSHDMSSVLSSIVAVFAHYKNFFPRIVKKTFKKFSVVVGRI